MGWPQITFIVLYAAEIILYAALHGTERTGKYNVLTAIISSGIGVWILYMGGFWG